MMMFVRKYISKYLDSNTYMLYNNEFTIIIDPSVSYEEIKKDLKSEIIGIFLTHGHFDHFYELDSYLKNTNAFIYLHKNAVKKLEDGYINYSRMLGPRLEFICDDRYKKIEEGTCLLENGFKLKIMEMPGHSDCSIIIICDDIIFTGDFIFKRSIGRTDLYSGNQTQMNLSLSRFKDNNLFNDYDDYILYPGHDEMTTRNEEIKYDPYLK